MKLLHLVRGGLFALLYVSAAVCEAQDLNGSPNWTTVSDDSSINEFASPSSDESPIQFLDDAQNSVANESTNSATRISTPPLNPDHYGLVQFFRHFRPYEPMYFVGGWEAPNIKFQFSFRYQIYTAATATPTNFQRFWEGVNVAYSQTSLWDVSNPSEPFFYDSSYRPEIFYEIDRFPKGWFSPTCDFNVQLGAGHESNGLLPPDHRSMNIAFIQPTLRIGQLLHNTSEEYFLTISPRIYGYIDDISQNPDIAKYRGYCDLRLVFGREGGWQLATIARVGNEFDRGSAQIDFTYPLGRLFRDYDKNTDLCLDLQYFIGYGDTLLTYNQRSSIFRLGLSLYRY